MSRILYSWFLRLTWSTKIYVFSDSHGKVFDHLNKKLGMRKFKTVVVEGATAMGMVNPNSKTDALGTYRKSLIRLPKSSELLFLLGEVDTGFIIWYRAQVKSLTVTDQFEYSLTCYSRFIKELVDEGFHNITIMSAPLPTIGDNQTWGNVANLRKEVKATQLERTDLTLNYNKRLKEMCEALNLRFLDLDSELLGSGQLVNKALMNKNKSDHHLDNDAYSRIVFRSMYAGKKKDRMVKALWAGFD
ncbi:MAG: hypothetical protein KDD36_10355 [Flavobacteriales bacterium]|nr:hypothetical protein [Flavobacteriales bacterium]